MKHAIEQGAAEVGRRSLATRPQPRHVDRRMTVVVVAGLTACDKTAAAALLTGEMVVAYDEMDGYADTFRDANVDAAAAMFEESASNFRL